MATCSCKQKEVDEVCSGAGKLAIDENVMRDGLGGKEALRANSGRVCCNEDHNNYVRELKEMVAEMESEIDRLKSQIATLDKENEEYFEEVADMSRKMTAMERELERRHSVILALHARDEEHGLSRTSGVRTRCSSEPKRPLAHYVSSPSCISKEVFTPEGASLEVKVVLQCQNEEAQKHLKIFFEIMDTSSHHAAYTSGKQHRDWRCLAEHVGLHEADLQATNCERRLSVIFDEWAKREKVTVAKVHEVLVEAQCTRAAEFLVLAAQCAAAQEESAGMYVVDQEDEAFLDLGGDQADQSC